MPYLHIISVYVIIIHVLRPTVLVVIGPNTGHFQHCYLQFTFLSKEKSGERGINVI